MPKETFWNSATAVENDGVSEPVLTVTWNDDDDGIYLNGVKFDYSGIERLAKTLRRASGKDRTVSVTLVANTAEYEAAMLRAKLMTTEFIDETLRAKLSTKEFVDELRTAIANGMRDDHDAKWGAMDRAKELAREMVSELRIHGIDAEEMPTAVSALTQFTE